MTSHPVWVRGLKHQRNQVKIPPGRVAPRVGAWIETYHHHKAYRHNNVAPRVGAWIETLSPRQLVLSESVAPRVGAWIETGR